MSSTNSTKSTLKSKSAITPPQSPKYKNYQDCLTKHKMEKDDARVPTNTSIRGGKYHIPDEEYPHFLKLYNRDIVSKGSEEFLTEKQRDTNGPIVVDIDLKYGYEITEKQYTKKHIDALVVLYSDVIKDIYQLEDHVRIPVFIFEKPHVNRLSDKNLTKDGIHMIIGIQCDRITQTILRSRVIEKIAEMELWNTLSITNTWEDMFDKGISEGYTNWQLYGSKKPEHDTYRLTHLYELEYDSTEDEMIQTDLHVKKFDFNTEFEKLSVRYTKHPIFFFKACFIPIHDEWKNKNGNSNKLSGRDSLKSNPGPGQNIMDIRNHDELNVTVQSFLDSLSPQEYELQEMYEYTMILPESFYGTGSYLNWMRVGWALCNVSKRLLIVWIAFSARSSTFQFSDIPDMCKSWSGFHSKREDGLTKHSIMYWAREHCPAKYESIRAGTVDFYLEQSLKSPNSKTTGKSEQHIGCGDYDIAFILHKLLNGLYHCASIKGDKWYRFANHRWVEDDSGTTIRSEISGLLRSVYKKKRIEILTKIAETDNNPETPTPLVDALNLKSEKINQIIVKLSRTTDKDHILKESKELFFDKDIKFMELLDSNPYLMGFNNGVLDIKNKVFRAGRADDYISKSTLINYTEINEKRDGPIMDEIHDFMNKLFPVAELREYVWVHMASTLVGVNLNQTLNMYIGVGENGNSIFTDLMSKVMGEYKSVAPLSLITQPRQKQGQASPDIVALKGVRYAVMAEPTKGDKINDGSMKELTSCIEPISGRNLFSTPITFVPQFKLVVCANIFMEIKNNDHATWRRIRIVDFMSQFTDNPVVGDPDKPHQFKKNATLLERLPAWKEVFMAMLVRIVMRTQGFVKDCPIVMESSLKYREREDYLAQFVRDKVDINKSGPGKIKKDELNQTFKLWYESNIGGKDGAVKIKELHEYMDRTLGKFKMGPGAGCWVGASIRYDRNEPVESENDIDDCDVNNIVLSDM